MIQTKTKNKSFITMWRYLQDLGIENPEFILELKDESLAKFDIEDLKRLSSKDPEYTVLEKKIQRECERNIWFYFRELIRIPNSFLLSKGLTNLLDYFTLTPERLVAILLFKNNKSFFLQKHKKVGLHAAYKNLGLRTFLYFLFIYSNLYRKTPIKTNEKYDFPKEILIYEKSQTEKIEKDFDELYMSNERIINYTSCFSSVNPYERKEEYKDYTDVFLFPNGIIDILDFLFQIKFFNSSSDKSIYGIDEKEYSTIENYFNPENINNIIEYSIGELVKNTFTFLDINQDMKKILDPIYLENLKNDTIYILK